MAVETIYKTKNESGRYSCGDIGITTEEWYGLHTLIHYLPL